MVIEMDQQSFLNIIDKTPLVSVDLIIENPAGEVLLGKRLNRPAQGFWFVPGGRIRKNETIADAIRRVSSVELGMELSLQDSILLGAFDHIYTDNFAGVEGINTHYVALGHKFILPHMPDIKTDQQHDEMHWIKIDALLNDDQVHPNTKLYFMRDK